VTTPSYDAFVDRAHARIYSQPEHPCRDCCETGESPCEREPAIGPHDDDCACAGWRTFRCEACGGKGFTYPTNEDRP